MSNILSAIATAQALALVQGPGRGPAVADAAAALRILDAKVTLPVGSDVLLSTEYARFGFVPAGAKIIPNLTVLSSDHSAAIPGKLQLAPLDGTTAQDIAGVTVLLENTAVSGNAETPNITSVPDVADAVVAAKDSWVQFVPSSNLTIASTAKTLRARVVFSQPC